MILYYINKKTFFIISDTLLKDLNRNIPIQYTAKVFTVPHLDCFIFGIGVFTFTKAYYENVSNVVTENFDYLLDSSEKICIDIYHKLNLHKSNIFTKVFLVKRNGLEMKFGSFTSTENFKPEIVQEAIGFFPDKQFILDKISPELSKGNIDIKKIVDIIKLNENEIESGGEYYLHMFSDENNILISRLGKSDNYKRQMNQIIKNCSIITERKGISIYWDQNIWGNLLEEIELEDFSDLCKIIQKIQNGEMHIGYSSVNIDETLRRSEQTKILEELTLIKKITNNVFIDHEYKFMYKNPFDLWKQKKDIDPLVDRLISEFKEGLDELVKSESNVEAKKYLPSSQVMNNINPEEIFAYLDNIIKEQIRDQENYDPNKNIMKDAKTFYNRIVESIIDFLKHSFSDANNFDIDNLLKMVEQEMRRKGNEILNQEIKITEFKATELDSIFKKLGHKEELLPGFMNGFLEASNYYPDKNRLKEKKGEIIDSDDMSHVNYAPFFDYFVTEDKRLSKRIKAVKEKMEMKTGILNMKEFIELIDNL